MANCERICECTFFARQIPELPQAYESIKNRLCLGDKTECARYKVASVGLAVPSDLSPNDLDRALHILVYAPHRRWA